MRYWFRDPFIKISLVLHALLLTALFVFSINFNKTIKNERVAIRANVVSYNNKMGEVDLDEAEPVDITAPKKILKPQPQEKIVKPSNPKIVEKKSPIKKIDTSKKSVTAQKNTVDKEVIKSPIKTKKTNFTEKNQQNALSEKEKYKKYIPKSLPDDLEALIASEHAMQNVEKNNAMKNSKNDDKNVHAKNNRNDASNVSAEGAINVSDLEHHKALIRASIISYWRKPLLSDNALKVKIKLKLESDGTVTAVNVQESSGQMVFDDSAIRAVYAAQPLPVPSEYGLYQSHFSTLMMWFSVQEISN